MVDLKPTIIAKSDQLNADDLLGGPITVKITAVKQGNKDQPINIYYEGDNNRPFKPCLSMRRLLVAIWGDDGSKYIGKRITLFRDPSVKWAGQEIGGIRISHIEGIQQEQKIALQVTRGKKAPYVVKPLNNVSMPPARQDPPVSTKDPGATPMTKDEWVDLQNAINNAFTTEELDAAKQKAMALKPRMTETEYAVALDLYKMKQRDL
jgi:hypothetical protein